MRILISGASGFIGSNLVAALRFAQHEVVALVRERSKVGPGSFFWDPLKNHIDPAAFAGVDAIINLAGENIGGGRWSATRKKAIYESRILGTRSIVHALSQLRENVPVLISASAVGIYGDRGDEVLTEESSPGVGFLARVGMEWEGAAMGAQALGTRVVLLRFGVVLSKDGGVLKKLLPIFRIGLGGRLGSGTQYMSWIGLPDLLQIFLRLLVTPVIKARTIVLRRVQ
jgi:uncharacterized protein (TIGR01777 family)